MEMCAVELLVVLLLVAGSPCCSGQDADLNLILITPSPPPYSTSDHVEGAQEAGLVLREVGGGRYACRYSTSNTTTMPPGSTEGPTADEAEHHHHQAAGAELKCWKPLHWLCRG